MATDRTKKKIGAMPCEGARCKSHATGQLAVVFQNSRGTLSYNCGWCGRIPHALEGSEQHAEWMADMVRDDVPKRAPDAQPAGVAPVAVSAENATDTAPKKKTSLFA